MRDILGRPTGASGHHCVLLQLHSREDFATTACMMGRLGLRHASNQAAASIDPFASRVNGSGPARWEAPPRTAGASCGPLGPFRPWDRFACTLLSTYGEASRGGATRRVGGRRARGRSPRDCGARLRRRRKRRPGSAGASRQPLHHRHARSRLESAKSNGVTTVATPFQ
jgi:hypothetical protein